MKLIELHILQSFPVTCLNRDDVGAPKSAVFGGASRARVSSQCWKRAIRCLAAESRPEYFAGKRGHFIAGPLQRALEKEIPDPEKTQEAAEQIASFLGDQDKKYKEGHKTAVALYLSPGEMEGLAKAAAEALKGKNKVDIRKGTLKKAIQQIPPKDAADIAIFGRMVASDHTLMVEGAGLFSHALSTHRANAEVDFFSAVDDLKPEESEGAGHIGTLEFNSACYYRYIGLNMDLLRDADHLGHFADHEIKPVIDAFLKACILAVPVARRNSMLGHNPPAYVLGLARTGQPLSLINAFEEPVWSSNGYLKSSMEKMMSHYENLKKIYNLKALEVSIPDKDLNAFCEEILKNV